jgi:AraC-like DNA-binding protein
MAVFFEHTLIDGIERIEEAVAGTHLEPTQLKPGSILGEMTHLKVGNALLSTAKISGAFRAYGPLSISDHTVGALLDVAGLNNQWHYHTSSGDLAVVPPGVEHDARYSKSTHWVALSLPLGDLLEGASLHEIRLSEAFWSEPAMYRPPAKLRPHIVTCIKSALQHVEGCPGILEAPYASQALLDHIVTALLKGYASVAAREIKGRSGFVRASRIVRDAEDYVRMHLDQPVRVQELCKHLNVSARTLSRAFKEKYDLPPAVYLRRWRLCQVRRMLTKSDNSEVSVSGSALAFGFWEFGRFANQYRHLFGELPSETLRLSQAALGRTPKSF